MRLTVLGCSGAYPTAESGATSYLLEADNFHLLIDAGSGTFTELRKHLDPLELDAAIITHYHYDHIGDVGVLQYYRQLNKPEDNYRILPIYGHDQDLPHFKQLTLDGVSVGEAYNVDETLMVGPFNITFMKTIHPVPTFALRIFERKTGKVLVFTADSGYTNKLINFSADADVFLADTYFLNGHENHPAHLTAQETGQIAKEAHVKKVILTHLKENIDKDLLVKQTKEAFGSDQVTVAHTGAIYDI